MRDYIKNILSMQDILYRYGVKHGRNTCCCPFHNDKNPSMIFDKIGFKCFGCGKSGDIISFVEYLYNLDFKQAMQKINEDFNLGLDNNAKIDYNKISEIKREREEKERYKNKLWKEFSRLCNLKLFWEREIKNINNYINILNVDKMMKLEIEFQDELWKVEDKIEDIEKKMATII